MAVDRFKQNVNREDIDVSTAQVDKVYEFFSKLTTETLERDVGQFSLRPGRHFPFSTIICVISVGR